MNAQLQTILKAFEADAGMSWSPLGEAYAKGAWATLPEDDITWLAGLSAEDLESISIGELRLHCDKGHDLREVKGAWVRLPPAVEAVLEAIYEGVQTEEYMT